MTLLFPSNLWKHPDCVSATYHIGFCFQLSDKDNNLFMDHRGEGGGSPQGGAWGRHFSVLISQLELRGLCVELYSVVEEAL